MQVRYPKLLRSPVQTIIKSLVQKNELMCSRFFTTPKWSLGQGNIFTCVCHSVQMGSGFPACITGHMASIGGSAFRGVCLQGVRQPPPKLEKRAVRILLECFLVWKIVCARLRVVWNKLIPLVPLMYAFEKKGNENRHLQGDENYHFISEIADHKQLRYLWAPSK